uniref:SAP domain-containing protein n=1 Tax=Falco tinnunculus TaxID=100819 RepID=A0A8C4U7R8_FALTI
GAGKSRSVAGKSRSGVTLDGRPLHLLRVADLKAALEQRGLAKSGQKSALVKRLRGVS